MGSPFFVLVATVLALSAGTQQIPQTVSVQQCRCADINKCNARIAARTEDCKRVEFLRKIGDEAKIRGCLEAEQTENAPNGPPELGQYLMCVEQCSVAEAPRRRLKRNPVSCAFKLRCALAPLDETVQTAFLDCQKQLGVDPPRRLRESCECLRGADLTSMQC